MKNISFTVSDRRPPGNSNPVKSMSPISITQSPYRSYKLHLSSYLLVVLIFIIVSSCALGTHKAMTKNRNTEHLAK